MDWSTLFILLLNACISLAQENVNGSDSAGNGVREPRTSGRVIKLYSGSKSKPRVICAKEGFQADPTDCAIFYRCIKTTRDKYNILTFRCGPGTIYDPDIEVCNHPKNSKRTNCDVKIVTSSESVEDNEIEREYRDLSSPIIENPIYNIETTMSSTTLTKPSSAIHLTGLNENTWTTNLPQNNFKPQTKTLLNQITDDDCVRDGFMSDSQNCRKFYKCVGNGNNKYIKYEFFCSESTIWDDEIQACNHPWAVRRSRCVDRSLAKIRKNNSDDEFLHSNMHFNTYINELDQLTFGSKITEPLITKKPVTLIPDENKLIEREKRKQTISLEHFRKEGDKNNVKNYSTESVIHSQYYDTNKEPQFKLHIDDEIGSTENHLPKSILETKVITTNKPIPIYQNSNINELHDRIKNNKIDKSYNECIQSGFMGDPYDCTIFYRCVDNGQGGYTKFEFTCSEGTVWDSNLEACNHIWAVKDKCGRIISTEDAIKSFTQSFSTPKLIGIEKTKDEEHDSFFSTTTKNLINQYQFDKNTVKIENTTTIRNVHVDGTPIQFNQESNYNDGHYQERQSPSTLMTTKKYFELVNDSSEIDNDNTCTFSGFMGDKKDCRKFYRCIENGNGMYMRYEFYCGDGTFWDSKIEACNHQWAVHNCQSRNEYNTSQIVTAAVGIDSIKESTDSTHQEQTNEEINKPTSEYNNNPVTYKTEKSDIIYSDKLEICKQEGFVGDNQNCQKFYRCVGNGNGGFIRYEFSCGEETLWDSEINACNYQKLVKNPCNTTNNTIEYNSHPTTTENLIFHTPQSIVEMEVTKISSSKQPFTKKCIQEGFMGDENDCRKFYRCVENGQDGFLKYEFSCGEGTIWDQETQGCNFGTSNCSINDIYVSNTYLNENISTTEAMIFNSTYSSTENPNISVHNKNNLCESEGFYADTNNCKNFYRCVDDGKGGYNKYDFTCGEGTVWVQNIQACDHDNDISNCGYSIPWTLQSTNEQQSVTSSTSKSTISNKEYDEYSENNTHQQNSSYNDNCTSEGFYANKNDCKKFYRCVDDGEGKYTKYDFTCGEGTIWNEDIQACNHENPGKSCVKINKVENNKPISQEEELYEITESTSIEKQSSTTEMATYTERDDCVKEGYFRNRHDCTKFYRCVDDGKGGFIKHDFSCGDGTIWDEEITACNHPQDVSNSPCTENESSVETSSSSALTTTSTSTESISTESGNDTTSNCTQANSSNELESNNSTCSQDGFYANLDDCKKFYRCVDNGKGGFEKYDFSCGEGTIWDEEITACNHPQNVANPSCKKEENTVSSTTTVSYTNTNSTTESSYTESSNQNSSNCTQDNASNNLENKNDTCSQDGFYANLDDCKKFYRCVDNGKGEFTKYDFTCGEGTIWDQEITACNHPGDVAHPACRKDKNNTMSTTATTSTSTSTMSTSSSATTESTSTNSNQNISNCTQESTSKQSESDNITCTKAGFYADPNDCKKFYRCVDWDGNGQRFSIFHFDCGEGTIWDPNLETCNYEESVYPSRNCSRSQNTQESTTEQTTTPTSTTTATFEQTTTQQPDTSEHTTTVQQSTTEETTTTQHTTSTQQSTTTDQTSPQQTTTTEQTHTEEPTTEQSTTEQTTQQFTTSEQTTTQQTTTNDQTTQQSTTSEQTTTSDNTTQVSSTTEASTTTEEMTTEQTTSTQQTTTTEQTTQQSTTSEQTTTTDNTTQNSSTTEASTTTEETTTEQTTSTQQTTMSESTTNDDSTTELTTTTQSTTMDSNNQQTTTTTEGSTSEQSTTDEQTTTESQSSTTESTSTTQNGETTTSQSGQENTTEESSSSEKQCPDTEDDQYLYVCPTSFRRHPKYCNLFYQCTEEDDSHELKIAVFSCPNNTIYDESKTKCVEEQQANKKCNGQTAKKHRIKRLGTNFKEPIIVNKHRLKCPAAGHFPFDLSDSCAPAFLKCEKLNSGTTRGYVYQCPEGYFYWSISRRCERKSIKTGCIQSTSNLWNGKLQIPIEKRNIGS